MKMLSFITALAGALLSCACSKNDKAIAGTDNKPDTNTSVAAVNAVKPALTGKLVYHSYSCYGCAGTRMYLYDFSTNQLTWLNQNWNIDYPMNAHLNPDATKIVFMGQPAGSGDWDIFIWDIGSAGPPVNLTAGNGKRDEDPKFSPNGYRIAFKQNNDLRIMELNGNITDSVTNTPNIEEGMPYYTDDATGLLFAQGAGSASDIYQININGTGKTALANVSNIQEYYPITRDNTTFLYSRWYSAGNHHDQVYMGYFGNSTRTRLPFNNSNADYSDAFPCTTGYVVLSSTRSGAVGGYDLYVADINTGAIWSLNEYNPNINSSLDELGSCYR
ncbi:hypothetical protein [Chitinophaga sp. 212800010-3]|uniref:TolB family protein n=1 Tax=unclassified Chitinophaga TaxID=2619133 RepID=UPI002DE28A50|nr:WD40-like Beta Propeller Repeat [Chitinophaga sp. 212800010-3]